MAEGADKEEKESGHGQNNEVGRIDCYSSETKIMSDNYTNGVGCCSDNITQLITTKLPATVDVQKSKAPSPGLNSSPKVIINQYSQSQNTSLIDVSTRSNCTEFNGTGVVARDNCEDCTQGENGLDCVDGDSSRRHVKSSSLPHGVKLCPESEISSANAQTEEEKATSSESDKCLEEELRKAQRELKDKDAEVERLKANVNLVEGELEDLTASLFEEAHKMVKEAKMKEMSSEKSLKEAKMQLDGLQAEVAALKTLLITSTPSRPNLEGRSGTGGNGISIFKKQHKRCPSHNHLQYGRSDEETDSKEKEKHKCHAHDMVIEPERCEVDPALHAMFVSWRQEPTLAVNNNNNNNQFLQKIYSEDIEPCLAFPNEPLVKQLQKAIEENSIWVEPIPEKDKLNVATECSLLRCPRVCNYRMRFAFDSDEWFGISQLCRSRIAAVCEFLNYLRYMKNGLVKASTDDAYWEIIRLRKQIALAKLGIPIS